MSQSQSLSMNVPFALIARSQKLNLFISFAEFKHDMAVSGRTTEPWLGR